MKWLLVIGCCSHQYQQVHDSTYGITFSRFVFSSPGDHGSVGQVAATGDPADDERS